MNILATTVAAASVQIHLGAALLVSSIQQLEPNSGSQTHFVLQRAVAAKVRKKIICTFTFFRSHVERLLSTGVVSSPNYPGNYPNNHHSTQIIEVEQGLIVLLKFTAFDIEYQWNTNGITCAFDHLTITDGDGSVLMEKSCGSTKHGNVAIGNQLIFSSLPPDVRSRSNVVNLEFSTDYRGVMTGWSVTWSAVAPSGKCYTYKTIHFWNK